MSTASDSPISATTLLPHQLSFLNAAMSLESKRWILLRSDVGLGKGIALAALAGRTLKEKPSARVLFLVPRFLCAQFADMLRRAGVVAILLDRFRFRELFQASPGEDIWPMGVVTVTSFDFAKQRDIQDSLARTRWDLVVADEAQQLLGLRSAALRRVAATADRVVLSTVRLSGAMPFIGLLGEDVSEIVWRRDEVIDHTGARLDALPPPILHEVPFSMASDEVALAQIVLELSNLLSSTGPAPTFLAHRLRRSLRSSPAALERTLQGVVASIEEGTLAATFDQPEGEGFNDDTTMSNVERTIPREAVILAKRALAAMEDIESDSKLSAFGEVARLIGNRNALSGHFCVYTEYRATLFYLWADIENRGAACQVIHGGMGNDERRASLARYFSGPGFLVATRAAMTEGVHLAEVSDLVLYDVPDNLDALEMVLARFDRFGRQTQLNVYVLTPSRAQDGSESEALSLLRTRIRKG